MWWSRAETNTRLAGWDLVIGIAEHHPQRTRCSATRAKSPLRMMLGFFIIPMLLIAGTVYSLLSWLLDRKFWPRFARSRDNVVVKG